MGSRAAKQHQVRKTRLMPGPGSVHSASPLRSEYGIETNAVWYSFATRMSAAHIAPDRDMARACTSIANTYVIIKMIA